MDKSIFPDKENIPNIELLKESLGELNKLWFDLRDYVFEKYPEATEEWNFPGKKYGWSFRIKDKKRAIIYFLPRDKYFKVAFVFGGKGMEYILQTNVSNEIKTELQNARVYAEGRGIRISVENGNIIKDIKTLIDTKLMF